VLFGFLKVSAPLAVPIAASRGRSDIDADRVERRELGDQAGRRRLGVGGHLAPAALSALPVTVSAVGGRFVHS
jgi:hypothetical protein